MLVTMQVVVHISIAFVLAVVDVDEASNLAISFGRTDGWYQAFDTITLLILLPALTAVQMTFLLTLAASSL